MISSGVGDSLVGAGGAGHISRYVGWMEELRVGER